jgi:hypothetical protein
MVLNAWPFFFGGLFGAATLAGLIWVGPYDLKKNVRTGARAEPASMTMEQPPAAPSSIPSPPTSAEQAWVLEQLKQIRAESADLEPFLRKVHDSQWPENQTLLSGDTPELPKEDPRLLRLLVLLHLDPPPDVTTQSELPALLAKARADSDTLELWEKLAASRSPMEKAIREAARRQLYSNADAWSPSQEQQLNRLGWPPSP